MGFRFRKSFNAGPFRLNLSKSGVGWSVGTKGVRFTKKAGGGTRSTLSVPGTGLSYVKETGKGRSNGRAQNTKQGTKQGGLGCGTLFLAIIFWPFVLGYFFIKWCIKNNSESQDIPLFKRLWVWVCLAGMALFIFVNVAAGAWMAHEGIQVPTAATSGAEDASYSDVQSTPIPELTPSPDPTPEPTPEPTATPEPTETPEPTPTQEPMVWGAYQWRFQISPQSRLQRNEGPGADTFK